MPGRKDKDPMPQTFQFTAHGRVNLIGEHTDYNDGWVLPTAIPQKTLVRITPTNGREIRCESKQEGARSFILGEERNTKSWIDYIQGATKILADSGQQLQAFELYVESDVPVGSGLSSSAALEIALLKSLRSAFQLQLRDEELARIGQRIENEFVGAKVGIMDQMACAFASFGEALYLDTKTLEIERLKLPLDEAELLVINSGVSHRNSDGGYNQRRSECEAACSALNIKSLREMQTSDLANLEALPEILKRRARHVITENQRVHDAVKAFKAKDLPRVGELFFASHASMRDDYAVSVPEIDFLVELCRAQKSIFGARLTGGGFGGSIVALAKLGTHREVVPPILAEYEKKWGISAKLLSP